MSRSTTAPSLSLPESAPAAARAAFGLLRQLRTGTLDLQLTEGTQMRFGSGTEHAPRGAIRLRNWKVCAAALRSGDIGFAESFIEEDWSSPDLVELLGRSDWMDTSQLARPERDAAGHIVALRVFSSRIRGLRFERA